MNQGGADSSHGIFPGYMLLHDETEIPKTWFLDEDGPRCFCVTRLVVSIQTVEFVNRIAKVPSRNCFLDLKLRIATPQLYESKSTFTNLRGTGRENFVVGRSSVSDK